MSEDCTSFSVLSQDEIRRGLNLPVDYLKDIDNIRKDVPDNLKDIVHYAIAWGIDDDGYRREFIERAPDAMKKNLKCVVGAREDDLDEWLAGPEAAQDTFTVAYIAFSNMRMASDEIID